MAQRAEAGTQIVGEGLQHGLGLGRVVVDQALHIGEGVEQEVRLDLRLQQTQLSFGDAGLRDQFAAAGAPEKMQDYRRQQRQQHHADQGVGVGELVAEHAAAHHRKSDRQAQRHADQGRAAEEHRAPPTRQSLNAIGTQQPAPGREQQMNDEADAQRHHQIARRRAGAIQIGQRHPRQRALGLGRMRGKAFNCSGQQPQHGNQADGAAGLEHAAQCLGGPEHRTV